MKKIPRTHIDGAIFYIISAGDNNAEIFKAEPDYKTYLDLLGKYKEQYGFTLLGSRLLPNQVHLLLELKEGLTVSEIMHDITANYTKYFNAKYGRKGHLFKERYKMVVAEKKVYLEPLLTHIFEIASSPPSRAPRNDRSGVIASPAKQGEAISTLLNKQAILGSEEFIYRVNKEMRKIQAASRPKTPRKLAYISGVIIVLLVGINFYIYGRAANERIEASRRINEEKLKVEKELGQRYQTEMDSYYRDMARKLQIEKQKAKVLREKLTGEGR